MAYSKSPDVYIQEQDLSVYSRGNTTVGAALITPTVKGKVNVPTYINSYNEYLTIFGSSFKSGSDNFEYQGSIFAREYFANGGDGLLVTRIGTGSYAPATGSILATGSVSLFVLETLSDGLVMNNTGGEIPLSNGQLISGSENSIRWEIPAVNTSRGTFDLLIRRGDDNNVRKIILESYTNLSLDPNADNYISKVIGDSVSYYDATNSFIASSGSFDINSNQVRVKEVNVQMYDMLNPDGTIKAMYTASLPLVGTSGSFGGGSDGALLHPQKFYDQISSVNSQGFSSSTNAYNAPIDLLSNTDEYEFNILFTPGICASSHPTIVEAALAMCEERGDALYIVDPTVYGETVQTAITQASGYDSSYGAMYYPWLQIKSPATSKSNWVPPSTLIGGVMAFSDSVSDVWMAPAGFKRGGIPNVIKAERKLSKENRDDLYEGNVNPIATFPNEGLVVYGQKTLQFRQTALDRINVRRLLVKAKTFVKKEALKLLFENNTQITRQGFLNVVNPYFENIQQRQGLYAFQVIMDERLNTNEVIDRNELRGLIRLQPSKTIEAVDITFSITPTGVAFNQ